MDNTEAVKKDAQILITDFMERAQLAKTEMCRNEPMSDNPALLVVVFEPNKDDFEGDYDQLASECVEMGLSKTYQCGMIPLIHKPDPCDCLTDVIGNFPIDKFSFLFFIAESYRETAITTDDPDWQDKIKEYEHGDMAKDFAENPFTTITEILSGFGYDWDLSNRFVAFVDYKYDDKGLPVFTEMEQLSDKADEKDSRGRLDEMLYRGVQFMRLATQATNFFEKWDKKPNNLRLRKEKE